jgi:hypothetical protein
MQQRHLLMGLEGLLLEYLRFGAAGAKCWVGDREIDASRELIPVVETDHTRTLALTLNSCTIILDPGLIDRTYLLLNYADLDPDCVRTGTIASTTSNSYITITSATVTLFFSETFYTIIIH